jgi:nitrogen fixation-related uncharacterized protein
MAMRLVSVRVILFEVIVLAALWALERYYS